MTASTVLFDKETNTIHSSALYTLIAHIKGTAYLSVFTVSLVTRNIQLVLQLVSRERYCYHWKQGKLPMATCYSTDNHSTFRTIPYPRGFQK